MPAGIFTLIYVASRATSEIGGRTFFFWAFAACLLVWGARLAHDAVLEEVRNHTWEGQRMSSIGAWSMAWGKLFGATIYPSYVAGLCLLFFLVGYPSESTPVADFKSALTVIAFGVTLQCCAMMSGLEFSRADGKRLRGIPLIGVVLVLLSLVSSIASLQRLSAQLQTQITWYESSYDRVDFMLWSSIIFAAWGLLGCYRALRAELLYRTTPLAWLSFLIFLMIYCNGFTVALQDSLQLWARDLQVGRSLQSSLFVSFGIAITTAWVMAVIENKDLVRFRKAYLKLTESKAWGELLYLCPKWLVSTLLTVAVFVAMLLCSMLFGRMEGDFKFSSNLFAAALLLLLFRDVLLILWCHCTTRFKNRANVTALIYLFVLYMVVPWFIGVTGGVSMLKLFLPAPMESPIELIPILFQVGAMGYLLAGKWRQLVARIET